MAVRDPLFPAVSRCKLSAAPAPDAVSAKADLAGILGYAFTRNELLTEALTHPSAPSHSPRRHPKRPGGARSDYERLEFLGDRVLGLVIADLLWRRFPDETEGHLTQRLAHLVRRDAVAKVAEQIGLGRHLVVSPAEAAAGAASRPAILADVLEAVIAAVYLDGGFAAAFSFVERWWQPLISEMADRPPRDPKTMLQEWAQARGLPLPTYRLIATAGPDHARCFTVAVDVDGREETQATASSKRAAETGAAAVLLERLSTDDEQKKDR